MIHRINVNGKQVCLKQNKQGDRFKVIYPVKNEDGTINWFNLFTGGSIANLIIIAIIIIVTLGVLYEYSANINMFLDCFRVPGMIVECKEVFTPINQTISNLIP